MIGVANGSGERNMSKWASPVIEKLLLGEPVQFRPSGHSMTGKINHKDLVTVEPVTEILNEGDIVLCKVRGVHYLHLIKAIRADEFLIGNNKGGTNGWTNSSQIFGIVTKVE